MSRGFILVEASVVYVILSLALVALLPLFILCFRATQNTSYIMTATQLSSELLEEVRLRKWDQRTSWPPQAVSSGSPHLGPDPGETPGDKRSFNDVDDFDGWAEKPPLGPAMEPMPFGFAAYSRSVKIEYVNPDNPDQPSSSPTDYKRATVCAQSKTSSPVCLQTLFTNR